MIIAIWCLCLFTVHLRHVSTFNLEHRQPIIKRGAEGTYFGYSVALHKSRDSNDIRDSWLLVGAPLGHNLQPLTNQSGSLFKCPIYYERDEDDCQQVETDGRRSKDFEYEDEEDKPPQPLRPPGPDEKKDGQWLGVSVRSQGIGGKVIVCAHRYVWSQNLNTSQNALGLCYTLGNDLEWDQQLEPCKGRPIVLEHQQFGYCQAGTSLAFLSDGTALIGSPGPFTWRGTLFVMSVTGDFLSRDKNVYHAPLNDKREPIDKYSYLGMSVGAGRFFHDKRIAYAAGASRSRDHGQVYIFNKQSGESEMNVSLIIDGEQFASNFGYELLVVDINSDGYDDLVVGAPFYYSRKEGGAIYIYYNLRNCTTTLNCHWDQRVTGLPESQFGFALTKLGDINRDGYQDVAVGAPYEGNGAIYIYLGSANGLMTLHSQKIFKPEWTSVRTLGYSLSGGIDIDNNGYPDLLVGAYDSDHAILFRTRPIVNITTFVKGDELNNIDVNYGGCAEDRSSDLKCFSFEACFHINQSENRTSLVGVVVQYHIQEVLSRKVSRIFFKSDDRNLKHNYQVKHFTVQGAEKRYCSLETVYIQNGTRDILTPIEFRVNYTLVDNQPNSAVLNRSSVTHFYGHFKKDCGMDDVCESNMIMSARLSLNETLESKYLLNLGDLEEFHVEVNVTNQGEPAYEAELYVIYPISVRYIDVVNKSSAAKCSYINETIVSCSMGNPLLQNQPIQVQLRFETVDILNYTRATSENEIKFNVFVNSTSTELSKRTQNDLVAIIFKKAEIKLSSLSTKTVLYNGEVKGESAMVHFDDVGPAVWHSYQVYQGGPLSQADLIVTIQWPWQVANDKPQGKWLLYLESISISEGEKDDRCYVQPADAVNPLNLTKLEESTEIPPDNLLAFNHSTLNESIEMQRAPSRRRRDTEYVIKSETVTATDGKKRQVVVMDCKRGSAKCIAIECRLMKFPKKKAATILIKSRLWVSTLVEDYSQVDWVTINSYAQVQLKDKTIKQEDISNDVAMAQTLAYPDLSIQLESGAPIWVYIVAVLVGLLLLILMIAVLWKTGFFKRKRIKDPTLSGNLTKQSEQETLLNQ